ncbi:MAG TPA: hypothetical protein VH867_00455 [Burkholderiales bacterium]
MLVVRASGGLAAVKPLGAPDNPCRRVMFRTFAVGIFSAAGEAAARSLPEAPLRNFSVGKSIQRISGRVLVNGRPATLATPINTGDTVEVADEAEVVFVLGSETFILRNGSRAVVGAPRSPLKDVLRAVAGQATDIKDTQARISVASATIGIRN